MEYVEAATGINECAASFLCKNINKILIDTGSRLW